jgi:hypothetical protein
MTVKKKCILSNLLPFTRANFWFNKKSMARLICQRKQMPLPLRLTAQQTNYVLTGEKQISNPQVSYSQLRFHGVGN